MGVSISLDEEFKKSRREAQKRQARHATEGLVMGLRDFGVGVYKGVTGLFHYMIYLYNRHRIRPNTRNARRRHSRVLQRYFDWLHWSLRETYGWRNRPRNPDYRRDQKHCNDHDR